MNPMIWSIVCLVDRNARILLVDDQLPQVLEGSIGGYRDDVRTRRHHFAHGLVAERDHGLDQPPVIFFDDAFLGAGGDQRFDVLLLREGSSSPGPSRRVGQGLQRTQGTQSTA